MPGPASSLRGLTCLVALLATLPGCGTTGQPVQQSVWIETPDCASASCELRNDQGRWTLERTPGRVTVTTSPAPLEVICRAGELRTSASAPSTLPPASGGGLAAGAAIGGGAIGAAMVGMGPAGVVLIVAATLTGAGVGHAVEAESKTFAYPERIAVPLRCEPAAEDRPRIGLTVRGLTDEEARRLRAPAGSALVVAVAEAGRAAAAGLRAGDIVLRANGAPVDSAAQLEALVRALAPESTLTLQVRRDGALAEVRLLPAAVP
jgi:hypothetical protein